MSKKDLLYYLALQKAEGVGAINAKKLLVHCGDAQSIFDEKASNLSKIAGIGLYVVKSLKKKSLFEQAEKELEFIAKNNIGYSLITDGHYPDKLKHCADAPIVLFSKGDINLKDRKIISIVGTRNITSYGKSVLEELVESLISYNPIIVSGLAYGVDIYAHKLAVKHNLQTIAVLAHGLDRLYPSVHRKTASEMQKNGGLFTEFWSGSKPEKENFVKRNRIIAGLSEATIVIESAAKGGSLITADLANSYNRDVFAVPGKLTDTYSKGCNNLIKTNRAALLSSVADLSYLLNWGKETAVKTVQKKLFVQLKTEEKPIYNFLKDNGKQQLDQIALHCDMPIHKAVSILFNLEMSGLVQPIPGKIYRVV
ncbi:MAG: DNA-processing protein DprA [Flavobacteriaceae bacterium]|nr:DNA-processing protein DprA [Flavobacteriaceae bacterium]